MFHIIWTHLLFHRHIANNKTTTLSQNKTKKNIAISKVNTALQFTTIAIAIMHPIICIHGNQPIFLEQSFTVLCWVTGGTTLVSGWGYLGYSGFTESGNPSRQSPSSSSSKKREGK